MAITLASLQTSKRKPPRILIYGGEGIGKNTFAICEHAPATPDSHPGKPREGVVVIQAEDGLGDIQATAFPLASKYEEIEDALLALYQEDHNFNTLVVDSLDWLEPLVWDYTCRQNNWQNIEDAGYGKGYIACDNVWRSFFSGVTALRDELGMTIIMTAHEQIVKVQDPELPEYDRAEIKLHKRAAGIAKEYCDIIFRAQIKTMLTTDSSASKQAKKQGEARQLAVTTGQRIVTTQTRPGATSKNRYHLPAELPLDWSAFQAAMDASLVRQPQ